MIFTLIFEISEKNLCLQILRIVGHKEKKETPATKTKGLKIIGLGG